ncbi:MAG TPA: GNAT family N-acetyltransferase [Gemmatimonadaceae bacterium]|nr:GNAT family N-acetyltransferase [Gemmatimonadaceae bacterium]
MTILVSRTGTAVVQRPAAAGWVAPAGTRDAVPDDNAALVALARLCPMEGEIGLCIDRAPDFFALNALEGERWRVGVTGDAAGRVVGCVAAAERTTYLNGQPVETAYISDLKVHPAHRGTGAADALSVYARDACRDFGGDRVATLMTVLAGNARMERRTAARGELPPLRRFATIHAYAVPLLTRRPPADGVLGLRVGEARHADLEEMAALWGRVAPGRQFAPLMDAEGMVRWMGRAPGLHVTDYLLARGRDGRIAGFLALWDQRSFKQLRVVRYSPAMAAMRLAVNALAPLAGAPPLPREGSALHALAAVHVCASDPAVLHALLVHGYNARRRTGYSFFTIGLDARDPLAGALRGFWAQPTAVHAYAATPSGPYSGPALDDRPLHHETALV